MKRGTLRAFIRMFVIGKEIPLILALDTSTAACTAALLTLDGGVVESRDERIGRGHAERLVPMIQEMLGGHVPTRILAGVGPGSFTGLRVGIAAAHGMGIGWSVPLCGMNSLALLAASAPASDEPLAAAMIGGHGEIFVQQFAGDLTPASPIMNLTPTAAAEAIDAARVVGPAATLLVEARGHGEAIDLFPSASHAMRLPTALASLECRPLYARAPDAKPRQAA